MTDSRVDRVRTWWLGDDPGTLDDYEVAFFTGGPERVVLTAIAALEERGAIRLSNSLGEAALEQVSSRLPEDRLEAVAELAADTSLSAATQVAVGDDQPGPHPVERAVIGRSFTVGRSSLKPSRLSQRSRHWVRTWPTSGRIEVGLSDVLWPCSPFW